MSVRIMTAAWAADLPASEKLVLLALADCANDEGHCWPGLASLGRKIGKCKRSLQESLRLLDRAGHITRKENPGKGMNYVVHPVAKSAPVEEAATGSKNTSIPVAKSAPKPSRTVSSEANASAAEPLRTDPVKEVFDLGVSILTANGTVEKQARSLIGKWCKAKSEAQVLQALLEARSKASPLEWIEAKLRTAKWVSPSGYEYRGSDEQVLREAEKRNDMTTYWAIKGQLNKKQAA